MIVGESARLIREIYARDHQPWIIFMDEIDVTGRVRNCLHIINTCMF